MSQPRLSWPRPPLATACPEPVPEAVHRRLAFASARTREIWESRLAALAAAALATELQLIATGALEASLVWCPYEGLAQLVGQLRALQLEWKAQQPVLRAIEPSDQGSALPDPLTRMSYPLIVSLPGGDATKLTIGADRPLESARAFGYPQCCAAAWAERLAAGASDPVAVLLADPDCAGQSSTTGVMLGALGFGPVRHLPCRPGCTASHDLVRIFAETMAALGLDAEAGWLAEMMQWRARTSLTNGIAEVETGAFRFTWFSGRSAPAAPPMVSGTGAPAHAPAGLSSIFAKPKVPARRRGAPAEAASAPADEGFARAGFTTPFAHRSRWSSVVWEQSKLIRKSRTVLHPACGSGLLLELLVQSHPSLRVCGIEADAALAASARARLPAKASMILEADWLTEVCSWDVARGSFDLAFIDPEAMIDLPADARRAVVAGLARLARSTVLVATDRALGRFGSLDSMAAALGFTPVPGRSRRTSCLLASAESAIAMA